MPAVRRLMRHKRQLGIQTKPNTEWREDLGLLKPDKNFPFIRKGWPVFEKPYDPKHKLLPPSYRQYQKPIPPAPKVDRDPNGWTTETLHELYGKFQFEAKGRFFGKGEMAEKETFDTAFNLHLVGWLKVRSAQMLGHVQGDTYALSYFRRWLEEKHLSKEAGQLDWVRLWNFNTGLETPLQYQYLFCVKDKRKYMNRKVHILASLDKTQLDLLEEASARQRRSDVEYLDEHHVRNY